MNREFKPTSAMIRALFAAASLLASILVVSSMVSLANHYYAESQLASAQPMAIVQR